MTPLDPFAPPADPKASLPRHKRFASWVREYFLGEPPTFLAAAAPLCFLSMLLFTRSPKTNFIFDEQEALLANPYVRAVSDPGGKIGWLEAFTRDFWGLKPERTIGSYRPVPDLIWRALWKLGARDTPFLHHWVNVLLHGMNGALLTVVVYKMTRNKGTSWLAGAVFVASAVVTEAVSGVVGLADVLGGLGAILALRALSTPAWIMPILVFLATSLGLFSKESALCVVPLVPLAALLTSQSMFPDKPRRWMRFALAFAAALGAFVLYVELRRRLFPVQTPAELTAEANKGKGVVKETFAALLRWYAQPGLPRDPLNNPLIEASPPLRIAGALRVWLRGLGQVIFPLTLSGDYSAPQEPIPPKLVFPESVAGGLAMVVPLLATPVVGIISWLRWRRVSKAPRGPDETTQLIESRLIDLRPVIAWALVWVIISYFPVSNIPVILPTVRAERFWYFPVIGSAVVVAIAMTKLHRALHARGLWYLGVGVVVLYLGFQSLAARLHANDYTNDLVFWDATRRAVPNSAKAHLNYSVMLGARQDLPGRLESNKIALRLAPRWPMASVYLGDTLCRMHRAPEAMQHYLVGFDLAPNDMNLIALGVQCLWDEKMLTPESEARSDLQALADKHQGSWLKYIVDDTLASGEENHGVNPKYRPRGYNEGPKGE